MDAGGDGGGHGGLGGGGLGAVGGEMIGANAAVAAARLGRCPGCTKRPKLFARGLGAWQRCEACQWEWRMVGGDRGWAGVEARQRVEIMEVLAERSAEVWGDE